MRLFRVDFINKVRPPILLRGVTRAQVSRDMKERYGDLFLKVEYISHEDAEAQFGHFDLFKENKLKNDKYNVNEEVKSMNKYDFIKEKNSLKPSDFKRIKQEEDVNGYADFITPESELTEEMYFKVNIIGLPDMYMTASSAGMIKAKLRKMLKNMDMIGDIVKTPKADVRKAFRMKAMEGEDSTDESTIINELSKKTMANYTKKAASHRYAYGYAMGNERNKNSANYQKYDTADIKRKKGINLATKKLGEESGIVEVKDGPKDTKLSPNTRALAQASDKRSRSTIIKAMNINAPKDKTLQGGSYQEDNNLDEISKDMKSRYINKAANDLSLKSTKFGVNIANPLATLTPSMKNNKKKIDNRLQGIKKASEEVEEDYIDNTIKFGKPVKASEDVFEHEAKPDESNTVNFTSILTGDNPFYRPIQELSKNTLSSYSQKANNRLANAPDKKAIGIPTPNNVRKYGNKLMNKISGQRTAQNKVAKADGVDQPHKYIGGKKSNIKIAANEGHDEIQDKNVNGLDDNQKPEGKKTAKQFSAPKDAKSKMKSLKMEMKTEVAGLVIEKNKLRKNDMKMRAGKLDPKAMIALKTMSQDEAKVLVQGLPSNLRTSTLKELGIKEKAPIYKKTIESILLKREMKREEKVAEGMTDDQNQATKAYNDNKKTLSSLHRKTKTSGGQVHVDHTDEKGKKRSGRFNGMMRMGANTYAKVEPHDGKKGATTLLPIHQASNIRHVKKP